MVQTRSQTRRAAVQVSVEQAATKPIQKKPIIFQGFFISSLKHIETVQGFLGDDLFLGIHGMMEADCSLSSFWQFPSLVVDRDIIKTSIHALPLEERITMLSKIMKDMNSWAYFENTILQYVESKKDLVFSPEGQANLKSGVDVWSGVDLIPLRFFYIWVNQMNELFISAIKELTDKAQIPHSGVEKAKIIQEVWRVWIICRRFIQNRYAHCYDYNRLFYSSIKKMLEFITDGGMEAAFYAFAAFNPNLVCDDIHPVVDKEGNVYNHPELAICEDDPDFGPIKKTYNKFYAM